MPTAFPPPALCPRRRTLLAALVLTTACAGRVPLPAAYAVDSAEELIQRMQRHGAPARSYSALAHVVYFGPKGRLKTTASLVAKRPASLRMDVHGPHGGTLRAVAVDAHEVRVLDLANNHFAYGPAEGAILDRVLAIAPLGLHPHQWVSLLFGEVDPGADAQVRYDERRGSFALTWRDGPWAWEAWVAPKSGQLQELTTRGPDTSWTAVIEARSPEGLPQSLSLTGSNGQQARLNLEDFVIDPELDEDVFVLPRPPGVTLEHL